MSCGSRGSGESGIIGSGGNGSDKVAHQYNSTEYLFVGTAGGRGARAQRH
jgi:hypothetical protein